jgi:hypothetical protein
MAGRGSLKVEDSREDGLGSVLGLACGLEVGSSSGDDESEGEGEGDSPSREGLPTADPRAEELLLERRVTLGRHGIVSTDVGLWLGERAEAEPTGDGGEAHGSAARWHVEAPGELGEHGLAEGGGGESGEGGEGGEVGEGGEGAVEHGRFFTPLLQPWTWRQGGRLRAV